MAPRRVAAAAGATVERPTPEAEVEAVEAEAVVVDAAEKKVVANQISSNCPNRPLRC
jgi:hypothetical protein